jgi:hypothetical protein
VQVTAATIALSMSSTSLALSGQPGTTGDSGPGAVSYTVTTVNQAGYMVQVSAPDLSDGHGHTLAANALTDAWSGAPLASGSPLSGSDVLQNGPSTLYNSTKASQSATDTFSEDWTTHASRPWSTRPESSRPSRLKSSAPCYPPPGKRGSSRTCWRART